MDFQELENHILERDQIMKLKSSISKVVILKEKIDGKTIKKIKNQVGKVDVLFVSSHKETRKILSELGLNFYLVYPDRSLKDEYLRRYRERGSTEEFVDMMDKNFDLFIDSIENEEVRCAKIKLTGEDEYLDSFLNFMNFLDILKENEK